MIKNSKIVYGALFLTALLLASQGIAADNLGNVIDRFTGLGSNIVKLVSMLATVGGIGLFVWGLFDWWQSTKQGSQVRMGMVFVKLAIGGALTVAPYLLETTGNQFADGSQKRLSSSTVDGTATW